MGHPAALLLATVGCTIYNNTLSVRKDFGRQSFGYKALLITLQNLEKFDRHFVVFWEGYKKWLCLLKMYKNITRMNDESQVNSRFYRLYVPERNFHHVGGG